MSLGGMWDQLVDCICRPPRDEYNIEQLAGGLKGRFSIAGHNCSREDFVLVNKAGYKLQCSHYKPEESAVAGDNSLPVVIYCHCNSGSRRDAEEALHVLMPHGIHVVTLDFAGSGRSEGHWVSLGAHEVEDVAVLVEHIRKEYPSSIIGLWGRSMGAVTVLLYSKCDPSIAGVVVDSPFSKLKDLMVELTEEQKLPIPRAFMRMALSMMKRSVRKRAHFNIDDVSPIDVVGQSFIPALFGHSEQDSFINKAHSEKLHKAYAGDKNLILFEGDHNSHRPQFFYASALIFLNTVLQIDRHLPPAEAEATAEREGQLPSASDENAAKEEDMLVGRTLSVPWVRGHEWAGTPEELEEAWAAEVSRGLMEGDLRLADASLGRASADGRSRSFSEPPDGSSPSSTCRRAEGSAHGPTRTASAASELPSSSDNEVKTLEQQQAEEAAARRNEEMASERLRWQLMQEDEAELLSQALRLSMTDHDQPLSRSANQGAAPSAARPASELMPRDKYVPKSVAAMSDEDAEEAMLVEAIQASLREAGDCNKSSSPDHQPSPPAPNKSVEQVSQHQGSAVENGKSLVDALTDGHTSKQALQEDPNDVTNLLLRGQMYRHDMLDAVNSQNAESNGNVSFNDTGKLEPKSHHVLSVPTSEASFPSTPMSLSEPGTAKSWSLASGSADAELPKTIERNSEQELQDMLQRAAEAAARGDYSAAAAGRFDNDSS